MVLEGAMRQSKLRFIGQQGYWRREANDRLDTALMFQPRAIAGLLTVSVISQNFRLFIALSAILAWNAAVPTHNLFDAIYNHLFVAPNRARLGAAPAPRRFAQALASALTAAIAAALAHGSVVAAGIIEGVFAAAVVALVVFRFCAGAYLYERLTHATAWLPRLAATRPAPGPRAS
jgi:hypothetical protein